MMARDTIDIGINTIAAISIPAIIAIAIAAIIRLSPDEDSFRFNPEVDTTKGEYSYTKKPGKARLFHCRMTGLQFGMTGEGEVIYNTVKWHKTDTPECTPAGPLFEIKIKSSLQSTLSIYQLNLPHCEVTPGDALSVAHITHDGDRVKPAKVNGTYVLVCESRFGKLWRILKWAFYALLQRGERNETGFRIEGKYGLCTKLPPNQEPGTMKLTPNLIRGQILLFVGQERLIVFLLPVNVLLEEVKKKLAGYEEKTSTSDCPLILDQDYSLHCPHPHEVTPENPVKFKLHFGPEYAPTFTVKMGRNAEYVSLTLRQVVWGPVTVSTYDAGPPQTRSADKGPSERNRTNNTTTVKDKRNFFVKNRGPLVRGVKNVESIVDDLRSMGFHEEMAAKVDAATHCDARVRRILDSVTTDVLAEALFLALLEHEKTLMMVLLDNWVSD